MADGEVAGPIARRLDRAAAQIDRHLENGRSTPAVRATERFLRYLDNPKRPDTLSEAARTDLRARAEMILEVLG